MTQVSTAQRQELTHPQLCVTLVTTAQEEQSLPDLKVPIVTSVEISVRREVTASRVQVGPRLVKVAHTTTSSERKQFLIARSANQANSAKESHRMDHQELAMMDTGVRLALLSEISTLPTQVNSPAKRLLKTEALRASQRVTARRQNTTTCGTSLNASPV